MSRSTAIALALVSCASLLGVYLLLSSEEPAPPAEPGSSEPERRAALPRPAPPVTSPRPPGLDASPQTLQQAPEEVAAGPQRKAPANLPTRFSEPEVRAAVSAALTEAGARGAAITSVDCTEFPCIVYVENVNPHDSRKIVQAPSLAPYRQESGFAACFPTARSDGTGAGVCGYAYEPKIESSQDRDAALKRLQYRVEQMRDATR